MTGHDHPSNLSERRLSEVVQRFVDERTKPNRSPTTSLRTANEVLSFFVANARALPAITDEYLASLVALAREFPADWRSRAATDFPTERRLMVVSEPPVIRPPHRALRANEADRIIHADFITDAHLVPAQSVDLVLTSPPYAMQRSRSYGGIPEETYPEFTSWWMTEVKRILKPKGNVVIVIRPHVKDGRRSSYVTYALEWLEQDGWNYCDDLIWIKPDAPPVGHRERPRRAWEMIHWFSLDKRPFCAPKAAGQFSKRLGLTGKKGLGDYIHNVSETYKEGMARASDVIVAGVNGVDHSPFNTHTAQFPPRLAEILITMLCPPGGVVLDPFIGSGTTAVAAMAMKRSFIGFEKQGKYVNIARLRVKQARAGAA